MIIGKPFLAPKTQIGNPKTFSLFGKSFFKIQGVFLSGNVFDDLTFFNPFSASPRLSAQYPGFSAIQINNTNYTYDNNGEMVFTMPSASYNGFADVILLNEAGWGTLTQFSIKSVSAYGNYEEYQRPWKDGIIIGTESLSATFISSVSSVTFTLQLSTDTDEDGYTDETEIIAGTDINNPNEFPVGLFNVFNNI